MNDSWTEREAEVCFYHSADLDGHCSGAIVKAMYPECEMIGINYGHDVPWDIVAGKNVVMVDFRFQPFSDMLKLKELAEDLVWIDHHKSAIEESEEAGVGFDGIREIGKAGCELTWEYMCPHNPMPLAVELLGRYDVWCHSDLRTLPFQYGMRLEENTQPDNQHFWGALFTDIGHVTTLIEYGKMILKYEEQQNKIQASSLAFETELDGLRLIAINKGVTNSKVFDSVWDPDKYDAMCTFSWRKKGYWTMSLYSTKDDIDVSAVAKLRGGGGHKGAAGFQCNELPEGFLPSSF